MRPRRAAQRSRDARALWRASFVAAARTSLACDNAWGRSWGVAPEDARPAPPCCTSHSGGHEGALVHPNPHSSNEPDACAAAGGGGGGGGYSGGGGGGGGGGSYGASPFASAVATNEGPGYVVAKLLSPARPPYQQQRRWPAARRHKASQLRELRRTATRHDFEHDEKNSRLNNTWISVLM